MEINIGGKQLDDGALLLSPAVMPLVVRISRGAGPAQPGEGPVLILKDLDFIAKVLDLGDRLEGPDDSEGDRRVDKQSGLPAFRFSGLVLSREKDDLPETLEIDIRVDRAAADIPEIILACPPEKLDFTGKDLLRQVFGDPGGGGKGDRDLPVVVGDGIATLSHFLPLD